MRRAIFLLCACILFTSLSFSQQDSTGMNNKRRSTEKQNSTTTPRKDTGKKDTMKIKRDKKGGTHNNIDSTSTIGR